MVDSASKASIFRQQVQYHADLSCMVSPTLPFAVKTQEPNVEVYNRERDEIAREQQQREQRS